MGWLCSSWVFSSWLLAFVLAKALQNKIIRYFFYGVLGVYLLFLHSFIFVIARTFLVGQLVAILFLISTFFLIVKGKIFWKTIISFVIMVVVAFLVLRYSPSNASGTIVNFKKMEILFLDLDKLKEHEIGKYAQMPLSVKLYNPDNLSSKLKEGQKASIVRGKTKPLSAKRDNPDNLSSKLKEGQKTSVVQGNTKPSSAKRDNPDNSSSKLKEGQKTSIVRGDIKPVSPPLVILKEHQGMVKRNEDIAYINSLFRVFIWRDMFNEMISSGSIWGFSFGKPLRSKTLEILNWGVGEWKRDGWIAAHNSYFEIIYRAGIIGVLLIVGLFMSLFKMIKEFIVRRSITGILLCGIIINWFVAANFLLIFELPYTAIPIWTLYGMTFAYYKNLRATESVEA